MRDTPLKVEKAIKNTASADGISVAIGIPQDPAQAGKAQAEYLIRQLSGFSARARAERGDKPLRFSPFSAQCEAGNVKILRRPWNSAFFDNPEALPFIMRPILWAIMLKASLCIGLNLSHPEFCMARVITSFNSCVMDA
jgi:phage terminase large subunit-like protein